MLLIKIALFVLIIVQIDSSHLVWSSWKYIDECSLMCGGEGFREQERTLKKCYSCYYGSCCTSHTVGSERRNVTCYTSSCGNRCLKNVFIPHPNNPNRFYQCAFGRAFLHRCPTNTVWSQAKGYCDWTA